MSAIQGIMTIAEESTACLACHARPYLGGLGFGLKWNMGLDARLSRLHVERPDFQALPSGNGYVFAHLLLSTSISSSCSAMTKSCMARAR
jgi:1,4-alpha-glucan branching enzyme